MAINRSKRYRAAAEQLDRSKSYSLNDAVATLKKFPPTKFDQTVTVSIRLGVDPKQSDQMVRGTCPLAPRQRQKGSRAWFSPKAKSAKAAKEAGAEYVGFKDLMAKRFRKVSRISMWRWRRLRRWPKCASSARCSVRAA